MKPRSHLEFIDKRSQAYLTDWLIDGFVAHYVREESDCFYPHSSFGASGDPIFAICESYVKLSSRSQTKLRRAIEGLLVIVTPDAGVQGIDRLEIKIRLELLSIISILIAETGGWEASPRLVHLATTDLEEWGDAASQLEAYALVLRGLIAIAIKARMHSNFSTVAANTLEAGIIRMIHSPSFESKFVAQCARGLIEVGAENFFKSYEMLLRDHFFRMHEGDVAEQEHAYHTADLIIDRLPKQMMNFAPRMEIVGPKPRDLWLLEAWDSPQSRFLLHRAGPKADQLSLVRRNFKKEHSVRNPAISIINSNFPSFQVRSTLHEGLKPIARGMLGSKELRSIELMLKGSVIARQGALHGN